METKRFRGALVWLAIIAAILTLGYLSRNWPVPPDCMFEPDHPACKGR
jgi:hypothetical protein